MKTKLQSLTEVTTALLITIVILHSLARLMQTAPGPTLKT